jgi:NIMA (never in mitosis gene a)-related kinase 1/4/5
VQGKKFSTDEILQFIVQITLGVMAMHSKNILHRDIKTQNIFIAKNNILKIGDFGISKELETMTPMAMTSCGTPYFMPPEVCLGKPYDNKADVWAIGVILYELITFRKPFDSDTISGVFEKITK